MTTNHIEQAEKLINCLKGKDFLKFPKRTRKKFWKGVRPETLYRYAIVVEKCYNTDRVTFVYNPEKRVFVRTEFTGSIEFETKKNYDAKSRKCRSCENPCYKGEYTVGDFIDLIIRGRFEPDKFYRI